MAFFGRKFAKKIQSALVIAVIATSFSAGTPLRAQEEEVAAPLTSTIVGEPDTDQSLTTDDPNIPLDQLEFLVEPLLLEELEVEAAAWLLILQTKVKEKSAAEIAIKKRKAITETETEAVKSIEEAEKLLSEAEEAKNNAEEGTPEYDDALAKFEEAEQALLDAKKEVGEVIEAKKDLTEDEAAQEAIESAEERQTEDSGETDAADTDEVEATDGTVEESEEAEATEEETGTQSALEADKAALEELSAAQESLEELTEEQIAAGADVDAETLAEEEALLTEIAEDIEASAAEENELKDELVKGITELQEEQTAIADRLRVVLDELDAKGGDSKGYRTYIDAVSGLDIDVTDTSGLGLRVRGWILSEEGGLRWGRNIIVFFGVWGISIGGCYMLSRALDKSLGKFGTVSNLMRDFATSTVRRSGVIVGLLLALTALEVSLGPVLTVLGGVSFIFAFALQSNLSNFSSGLLLLTTKPFDLGDEVKVAGYWAFVDSITLANTKLKQFDGSLVTLPNNTVWGGDIINFTHSDTRKCTIAVDFKFTEDLDKVRELWVELASNNPKVLTDIATPGWFPYNSLYNSSICVGFNAWVKTSDHWGVYVELLKALQEKILELDIELAAPIQDIRVQQLPTDSAAQTLDVTATVES